MLIDGGRELDGPNALLDEPGTRLLAVSGRVAWERPAGWSTGRERASVSVSAEWPRLVHALLAPDFSTPPDFRKPIVDSMNML